MSFTDDFERLLDTGTQEELAMAERTKRLSGDQSKYIAIPALSPKVVSQITGKPTIYNLGWMIVVPRKSTNPDEPIAALPFGFPNEAVAEDFCLAMNWAQQQRKMSKSNEYRS